MIPRPIGQKRLIVVGVRWNVGLTKSGSWGIVPLIGLYHIWRAYIGSFASEQA